MKVDLSNLIDAAKMISKNAKKTFGSLSTEQLNWKPNAKSWSIAQCFEHLIVTNKLYFPNIQKVIDGTHRNNFFSKIPFSTGLIGVLMKNALNPDQQRKMKTFKVFEPTASNISEKIIEDFVQNQRELIAMIEACKNLAVHKIKIAEPLSVALNLRLDDAFGILVMHEKRHFIQAERVLQNEGFPK